MIPLPIQERLRSAGDPERAAACAHYFKSGPGESGEGQRFLGIGANSLRSIAKEFRTLSLADVETLLQSEWHEERGAALLILVLKYPKAEPAERKANHAALRHRKVSGTETPGVFARDRVR